MTDVGPSRSATKQRELKTQPTTTVHKKGCTNTCSYAVSRTEQHAVIVATGPYSRPNI